MHYIDEIDKENNLIRLTVGQVCTAGIMRNISSGERKCYAIPFIHKVHVGGVIGNHAVSYYNVEEKEIGLALRITNDGTIVGNPTYRGHAIIAFLDKKFETCDIHSVRITRVNKRSVNVEPIDIISH